MTAAIVVPFGSFSIFSTADCLDDDVGADDVDAPVFDAGGTGAVPFI
jgi:hypothetical protein